MWPCGPCRPEPSQASTACSGFGRRRLARSKGPCMASLQITLIGGPTALIEIGGFRLLTDPTFDPPGDYQLPHVTLTKLGLPALSADQVGPVDAVLLSHD